MATRKHAILSASGASRWLNCTPSAVLESKFETKSSSYADEGTLAHELSENKLMLALRLKTKQWYQSKLLEIQKSEYYNESMEDFTDEYVAHCIETVNHYATPVVFIEERVDLTKWVPEGFGTNDFQVVSRSTLEIIDLKYGKGVPVYAENNKQMMLYALGSIEKYGFIYDLETVKMTIFQPRIENVSSWEISVSELLDWAENELKPKAALAFQGKGEFKPGDHCLFCKAKATCRANVEHQMVLAKHDFAKPELLTEEELADILKRHKMFVDWIGSVHEYALEKAIKEGKTWPGFKLVEGRSNRKITDEVEVVKVLKKHGQKEEDFYQKKLIGITALQNLLGILVFNDLLSKYLIKPAGKPTLVTEKDKRPALNSTESATEDFK